MGQQGKNSMSATKDNYDLMQEVRDAMKAELLMYMEQGDEGKAKAMRFVIKHNLAPAILPESVQEELYLLVNAATPEKGWGISQDDVDAYAERHGIGDSGYSNGLSPKPQ
jgi:hypothetical protein